MRIQVWGSRGSIASAGPATVRYGGNTACVSVTDGGETTLVLDAGTGMRPLGKELLGQPGTIHILLTHLHMDHIQGLGFFAPLFEPGRKVHIWGPPSTTRDLRSRLSRYLSPPLFPVRIIDVESDLELHDVQRESWRLDGFEVSAASVIHPGPTVGYRITRGGRSVAYLPDHEPALGGLSSGSEWTSGWGLARGVDLLIHDGQYSPDEYDEHMGWGHSSVRHASWVADVAAVPQLMLFHHDPDHADETIDELVDIARQVRHRGEVTAACEGDVIEI